MRGIQLTAMAQTEISTTAALKYALTLRRELAARNAAFAAHSGAPHVTSFGGCPVTVYEPYENGQKHDNFLDQSYSAILDKAEWRKRLEKVHSQASRALPRAARLWSELDSCNSSDALLMNVFCFPEILERSDLRGLLGIENGTLPEFGFKAHVPLVNGTDRTEVDMKLGSLLLESKLTESDFQTQLKLVVERYRDFKAVFDSRLLPVAGERYVSYQLIRNVLAAHATGSSFCVLLDARRPDLLEAWYAIMRCILVSDLRLRCKVLTWQELAEALPAELQAFLDLKYGIVPPGKHASAIDVEVGSQSI